jgi:small conductance mechanosensitive channel
MDNMEALFEQLQTAMVEYGPSVVGALAILVIGYFVAKILTALVRRALNRAGVDETLVKFAGNIAQRGLMVMVVIAGLERLGVNTTSFAAVLAAAGLAVGLAFQDSLSNFASGVLVIVFRPFSVGDFVEAGGVSGTVEEVQIFTTVLKTPDNKRVIVGNSAVTAGSITNYSANTTRRVDMTFGIGYSDDIAKARRIIEAILDEDPRVLSDPEPAILVLELADSSVNFAVRPWCATGDYWGVYADVTEKLKLAFDAEGVSIPFPQNDVHLHGLPSAAAN